MTVASGVNSLGEEGPKTAMVEGEKTRSLLARATSSTLVTPSAKRRGGKGEEGASP